MKVLLASKIDAAAIRALDRDHDLIETVGAGEDELVRLAADREVIVFRSGVTISGAVIGAGPQLRLLLRAGSGLDNVDVDAARARGARLCRVPGPGARAVAELTFALLLNLARPVRRADAQIREGRWPKPELSGRLLEGKTLGVVGAGSIGSLVGEMGAAWGMRVLGCVEDPGPVREAELARRSITLTDLEPLLAESDFVTVHVTLQDSTRHLFDSHTLPLMKPGASLINTARGGVVDEAALRDALLDGRISGAALDVHETEGEGTVPPLAALPNVFLTPHIGAMADESQEMIGRRILELTEAFTAGRLDQVAGEQELIC